MHIARTVRGVLRRDRNGAGADAVNRSEETLLRYGENTMPGGDRQPAGVVYPASTADVQTIVRAANKHAVPLYPDQHRQQYRARHPLGIAARAGRRRSRQQHEPHPRRSMRSSASRWWSRASATRRCTTNWCAAATSCMLDVTSGPPQGGMLGNALDKGAGYTPYFDHFGFSCGMEVVLGNGELLRTGDGALDHSQLVNWHTSKYSFGPILDGLFTQSNYGIVTRMGVWLLPRPPAIRSFHFAFPDDDDLEEIIEFCRPLKLSNFVPTLFRRAERSLSLRLREGESPEYRASGGKRSISDDGRARAAGEAWASARGRCRARSMARARRRSSRRSQRVREHFGKSGKARYIAHEEAPHIPPLQVAINAFSGIPSLGELGLLKWRPGGGNIWFPPGTPMDGKHRERIPAHLPRRSTRTTASTTRS